MTNTVLAVFNLSCWLLVIVVSSFATRKIYQDGKKTREKLDLLKRRLYGVAAFGALYDLKGDRPERFKSHEEIEEVLKLADLIYDKSMATTDPEAKKGEVSN